jgi:hypothetical protein
MYKLEGRIAEGKVLRYAPFVTIKHVFLETNGGSKKKARWQSNENGRRKPN